MSSGLDSIPHLRGDELIAEYKRRYGDKTLLAFSRGKDLPPSEGG